MEINYYTKIDSRTEHQLLSRAEPLKQRQTLLQKLTARSMLGLGQGPVLQEVRQPQTLSAITLTL